MSVLNIATIINLILSLMFLALHPVAHRFKWPLESVSLIWRGLTIALVLNIAIMLSVYIETFLNT